MISVQLPIMKSVVALSALSMLAGAEAAETVLGAYIFHRHGDRTPKALAPTNLTALGYEQVYTSGQYYRSRYLSGDSKIRGINEDEVKLSQLQVQAPVDNVLQNSAMGFLQGLYPPVQTVQTLANGQSVQAPMDGYQLIPVNTIETGSGSEDNGWLQDASSCQNAKTSSNSYFDSEAYKNLASSSKDLYSSIVPSMNGVISDEQVSFKNAYVGKSCLEPLLTIQTNVDSLRHHPRSGDPQLQHPQLRRSYQHNPHPTPHSRRHPRVGSRLQRQRQHARCRGHATRGRNPRIHEQHHQHLWLQEIRHPVRRLRNLHVIFRSCRLAKGQRRLHWCR